jgi:ferrochelatase
MSPGGRIGDVPIDTPATDPVVLHASPAAAGGAAHIETPVPYDGILLASFGGPEGQEDVIPFLRNVTRGRGIPDERLEEVAHHYRHFGGISPINAQNRELKTAIEGELARRGIDLPVYWGNRNWGPFLDEAVREAAEAGDTTLLAVATSAYSSFSSCRQYREDFARVLTDTGLAGTVTIDKVRQFFDHPGFVAPFVAGVREAVAGFLAEGVEAAAIHVLFSTHSVPIDDARRSGPRDREWGDGGAYEAQHLAVAEYIMAQVADEYADAATVPWQLVYQSRSGPPTQPWLEPDVCDVIETLPAQGGRAVVIVPLGFVSDHMEVKWDLDTEAMDAAAEAGLRAMRTPTPGIDPAYVAGLVDLVEERLHGTPAADRPHVTDLGPWFDVCRPACCENIRAGFKPAASGIAP